MRLLGFTLFCGGVLGAGMLITRVQIRFSIMVILGIILVISLGEIVRSLNFKDRY
jgi:arginine exporter protein ArgO